MYYFIKITQQFFFPFNIALVALLVSLLCLRRKKTRTASWLIVLALTLLVVPALPIINQPLVMQLESTYPAQRTEDYPHADAIVVLGGSVGPTLPPRAEAEETGQGRCQQAAKLYHAGKSSTIVVTGGARYDTPDGRERSEAEDLRDVLVSAGVDEEDILLEDQSRNTMENAAQTAKILDKRELHKILLVSSAFHLRRAVPLFEHYRLDVTPVPCGFLEVGTFEPSFSAFLPDPESLVKSRMLIREYGGAIVQWFLGRS